MQSMNDTASGINRQEMFDEVQGVIGFLQQAYRQQQSVHEVDRDAIMDATYEEKDYAQFRTKEDSASRRNSFRSKRIVKNPFTGQVVEVDG